MANSNVTRPTRREFVKSAAVTTLAATAFPYVITGAEPDKPIRVGVVGCGGRGTGAARNAMAADKAVRIVALADVFADHMDQCYETLSKIAPIEKKNCFVGLDAYEKLLDAGVDYVILATPPYYRPKHLAACIEAGRHVFMEKPAAVDPVGVRSVMESGRKAKEKDLSIAAGTQRRHQMPYIETIKRIHDGAIGNIVAGQVYWNGPQAWYKQREKGWSDMEWMLRDWNNWSWLSGDHVVEQHVHNLDVANWVIGKHPVRAVAMGGRQRRVTGNQYDFFATDFTYPDEVHIASQCRQITGCKRNVSERVIGQKGLSDCSGWISSLKLEKFQGQDPYVQEHIDLIASIRGGSPLNEAQTVAESTLTAIMGRTSAYTGKEVTWDEMMKSPLVLGPPDYELTEANIRAHIPVAGEA